jgi:hypothetical protein
MPAGQDDDETRALLGELQDALGGEPDMTAASGLGPRDRDRRNEDDVIAGSGGGRPSSGGSGGGGGTRPPLGSSRTTTTSPGAATRDGGGRNLGAVLAALLVGLIVGGALGALLFNQDKGGGGDDLAGKIDSSRYQSVILSNDKVYFGQLKTVSDAYYELDNAFFLRETRQSADAEPVRALLPVNREIHAPDNTMLIRKTEVVLVENLAKDSPILTEIKRQKG